MVSRFVVGVLGVVAMSCAAPTKVGLRPILEEAETNHVALMAKYVGEQLRVTGKVSVVSIHKQRMVEHKRSYTQSEWSHKDMPYVYLVPDDGESGRALCFFPEGHYTTAARVQKGEMLTLDCWFQEYVTKSNDQVVVLNRCEIVD